MGLPFTLPKGVDGELSPNLYVANCGAAVGLSCQAIASVSGNFGEVKGVGAADETGARVIVSYFELDSAQAALKALSGHPCPDLGGRFLHIRPSILQPSCVNQVIDSIPVSLVASELNIPGFYLLHDFVSAEEEQELLAAVDDRPWKNLSKSRVQHYGYEFCYEIDMVNGNVIRRGSRRVSFTFHKIRRGRCKCPFPRYCDSRSYMIPSEDAVYND